jgi:uncharacterized delta-60 repeat protein
MALALLVPQTALAAAGDLDGSFDGDGKLTLDVSPGDFLSAVAIHGGKILAAGAVNPSGGDYDFVVVRLNGDGQPDPTFGGGDGAVTTDFGGHEDAIDHGLAVLPDGKVLVAGSSRQPDNSYKLALARYRTNGTLDPTFGGGDGKVTRSYPGKGSYVSALLLLPNGKFIVGGSLYPADGEGNFALWRFNANGTIDTSFGGGDGLATWDLGPGYDEVWRLLLMPDGDVLAAGWVEVDDDSDLALVRFNANGSIDRAFGTQGLVDLNTTEEDDEFVNGIALSGSKIIVVSAGLQPSGNDDDMLILRLKSNGARDTSFGGGHGQVVRHLAGSEEPTDVVVQEDGKIVIALVQDGEPAVMRLKPGGAPDTGFGTGGLSGSGVVGRFESLALQPNGRIVAVGSDNVAGDLLVARYLP